MTPQDTPATAKKRQLPHNFKQYDFPSGPLESLDISKIPALWPSRNLEMIHIFFIDSTSSEQSVVLGIENYGKE
jgi:hypothetical protein